MTRTVMLAAMVALGLAVGPAPAQDDRKTPYWASISAGKAMMRTGPGQNYPATWLYVRADLPIRVVETYPNWRRVSYLAQPGVVGRVSKCAGDWCHFDVRGRQGYIRRDQIWGVEPGENLD